MDITSVVSILVVIIGVLVFLVNVIVQVTKELIPVKTDYYVLGLSVFLSMLSYFVYVAYTNSGFIWYYLVAAIIVGFFVCYVAQNGWEKFIRLWEQSKKQE